MKSRKKRLVIGPNNEVGIKEILERLGSISVKAGGGKESIIMRLAITKMVNEFHECVTEEDFADFLSRWDINRLKRGSSR